MLPSFNLRRPRPARLAGHIATAGVICVTGLLLSVALAWAQSTAEGDADTPPSDPAGKGGQTTLSRDHRIREGTEIVGRSGHFRMTGDRVTFFAADGKGRFVGLENLNLERVTQAIAASPDQLIWSVTGTLTEFRGANFLLVRRAVLRSRVQSEDRAF